MKTLIYFMNYNTVSDSYWYLIHYWNYCWKQYRYFLKHKSTLLVLWFLSSNRLSYCKKKIYNLILRQTLTTCCYTYTSYTQSRIIQFEDSLRSTIIKNKTCSVKNLKNNLWYLFHRIEKIQTKTLRKNRWKVICWLFSSYLRNIYFEIISAYHTGFDTLISLHNNPLVKYLKYLPAFQDFSSILQILVLRTFVCEPWNTTISCKHSTLFTCVLQTIKKVRQKFCSLIFHACKFVQRKITWLINWYV